jgi:futalosine hydrolase
MLVNPSPFLENIFLPKVRAITVNTISDNNFRNQKIKEKFNAQIETMEGAAFHYVCLQQKIIFLQMRSISNKVGERNKSNWELQSSIENLNKELIQIIDNL